MSYTKPLTLYGVSHSRAFRNIWMLRELALEFEHVPIDFFAGEQFQQDYMKLNKNGRIPTLLTPDGPIFESLAINLYLASVYPSPLSPQGSYQDALAVQWSLWAANEIETPFLVYMANRVMFPENDRSQEELELAERKVSRPLAALEATLEHSKHVLSERFTVADLNIASILMMGVLAEYDFEPFPKVNAWLKEALERPSANGFEVMKISGPRPPEDFWKMVIM